MKSGTPASIAEAFDLARTSDAGLAERLTFVAEAARVLRPDYTAAVEQFVSRLLKVEAGADAPAVGEAMPHFVLPDQDGRLVRSDSLLAEGPLVIAFHRGHWCSFCRLTMAGLAEVEPKLEPARVVAISSELPRYTRLLREEAGASFPFLTDLGVGYALSLGLAVWIDETLARLISQAGLDIPLYQGGGDWLLPIPAVFLVRPDGIIAARHIDPDFRRRIDFNELRRTIDSLPQVP